MESNNRNTCLVVALILVVASCCILAVAAGAVAVFVPRALYLGPLDLDSLDLEPFFLDGGEQERLERTIEVSGAPRLEIDNFAGSVTVRAGGEGEIRVSATKRSSSRSRLDQVQIDIQQQGNRVVIRTRKPNNMNNVSVDLQITAPSATELALNLGAGTVDLRGLHGGIEVDSGAGDITVRDAVGSADLNLGAGQISYEGSPTGYCRFGTGAGNINLRLPANPDLEVELETGLGNVDVDYAVDGTVRARQARGTIGDGSQGTIRANTGVGNISLSRR